jgi:hypothetical protein
MLATRTECKWCINAFRIDAPSWLGLLLRESASPYRRTQQMTRRSGGGGRVAASLILSTELLAKTGIPNKFPAHTNVLARSARDRVHNISVKHSVVDPTSDLTQN